MNTVLDKVYSIVKVQLGDSQASKFLVEVVTDNIKVLPDREQMKYLNNYFTKKLQSVGVDEISIYRLTEVSIDDVEESDWLYKINLTKYVQGIKFYKIYHIENIFVFLYSKVNLFVKYSFLLLYHHQL